MLLDLKEMTIASFLRPASAARDLIGLGLDRKSIVALLALSVVLTVISLFVGTPGGLEEYQIAGVPTSPLLFAVIVFLAAVGSVIGINLAGRMLGGAGNLDHIALVLAWTQWLQFILQLSLSVLAYVMAPLAVLLQLPLFLVSIWIFLRMLGQVFGADSVWRMAVIALLGNFVGAFIVAIPIFIIVIMFGAAAT